MLLSELKKSVKLANQGDQNSVCKIMDNLNENMTLQESRELDYAIGQIEHKDSVEVIKEYLFHGSQIQRNYAALFFGRIHEYFILREAYDLGLIDDKQAFSR